jgi:hypothetical protein
MSDSADTLDFGDIDISDLGAPEETFDLKDLNNEEETQESEETSADDKEEVSLKLDSEEPSKPAESKETIKIDEEKPSKVIAVSSKGKKLELDPEAEVTHKVDGKPVVFKIKDLLNTKAGEVSYAKKFQELGDEKKNFKAEKSQYETERDELFQKATKFAEKAKSGDPFASLAVLAELAGENPLEFVKNFKSQMIDIAGKYSKLSEPERKAVELEDELRYNKAKLDEYEADSAFRQTLAETEKQVSGFQTKNQLSDEELIEIYDNARQGKPNEAVTVADLEAQFSIRVTQKTATEILSSISPDLSGENNVKIVTSFMRQNPGITKTVLSQMIKDELGLKDPEESKPGKSANKIVSDKIRKNSPNKKFSHSENEEDNDFASFDDIQF